MNKAIITVLGKDRPGIISLVSTLLYELDYILYKLPKRALQK